MPVLIQQQSRSLAPTGAMLAMVFVLLAGGQAIPQVSSPTPPEMLKDTGLYSDFRTLEVDPNHLAFSPQYPLWTDGATKRRWISLPPGKAIDGSDPDAWVFPVGTRLWRSSRSLASALRRVTWSVSLTVSGFTPRTNGARTAARRGSHPKGASATPML
jgi:hypothetical protein